MAAIGYNPEEITMLCESVSLVEALINNGLDEVTKLYKNLCSDNILADSEYRDELVEVQKKFAAGAEEIAKVLEAAKKYIDEVAGAVGMAVTKNTMSIEDQNALIAKSLAEAATAGDR